MKRLIDIIISTLGLVASSPVMIPILVATWWEDKHSPFYVANRVGKDEKPFRMVKVRSMIVNADKTGVASTSANDRRITKMGKYVRKYKLDEISQLWNVLIGDMSLVGPRPNVESETRYYTATEKRLLSVKPGITDISSIVFSDEGDILKNSTDPDLDYNQLIRPWKSRLGLLYIDNQSFFLDIYLIYLTALAIISKPSALKHVNQILHRIKADSQLIEISKREQILFPFPPPGATQVVYDVTKTPA
jgi:lipopolysaccharide/colanic/teichoic acid biosynthesis glycosyltransferase